MSRPVLASALLCIACVLIPAPGARAQGNPPGTVTISAAATGLQQFSRELESGGKVRWSSAAISVGVTRQVVPAFTAGVSLRHVSEDWRFDAPAAFGGRAPWRRLQRTSVGVNLTLALSRTFLVGVSPAVDWALDRGASAGETATYGAVVSAAKRVRPDLTLGGGVSVFRQFYSVKISPFVIVNWKLNDRLRIANAISSGPEGGAGVELRWTLTPDWETAVGGVTRSDRYRLVNTGTLEGNVGETSSLPMFARLSRKLGTGFKADLYAGVMASGRLRTRDSDGHEIASAGFGSAPAIAATISFKR